MSYKILKERPIHILEVEREVRVERVVSAPVRPTFWSRLWARLKGVF